jgi:hypothetical protein
MRGVYQYMAWIVFLAVIVQVGFAGYGAFKVAHDTDKGTVNEDKFGDAFGLHAGFGYLAVLLGLLLLIVALVARVHVRRTLGLLGLLIVQVLLAWFGYEIPVIGFFHPINALLIVGLSGSLAYTTWRGRPGAVAVA